MRHPVSTYPTRAAAPGRPKQGPIKGHAGAPSLPSGDRRTYPFDEGLQ